MKTVFKYHIAWDGEVKMFEGAEIVKFAHQNGMRWIWAIVDTDNEVVQRRFHVIGTGWEILPENGKYIGTDLVGDFVWHLFESV